jgi:phosphoserine phosphatase RsbU/P
MGHGVAAALHTMHLSSLWDKHCHLLTEPAAFARILNNDLAKVVKGESFATAVCGVIDANERKLRFLSAGGPPGLAFRGSDAVERIESAGLPFGLMEDADYDEVEAQFHEGDCLLFFSDGGVEVHNAQDELLGTDGLIRILRRLGYPASTLRMNALEEELLLYSNSIRLLDDLAFIEVRF